MPQHNWFAKGEWNACCEICGRVFKSSKLSPDWDNSMRCKTCIDGRHPQDYTYPKPPDAPIPWARPWIDLSGDVGIWINVASDTVPWSNTGGGILQWIY